MSNYAKGTAFEHAVRDHLRLAGYDVVRSAGSKTKIDLIAWKQGQILFIQCKLPGSFLSALEWNTLDHAAQALPGCLGLIANKVPRRAEPEFIRVLHPRAPRQRVVRGRHWEPWVADTVADTVAEEM